MYFKMEDNDLDEISTMDTNYNSRINGGACGALKRKKKEEYAQEPPTKLMNIENLVTMGGSNSETNVFAYGSVKSGLRDPLHDIGGVALRKNYNGICSEMRPEAVPSEYKSIMCDTNVLDIRPFEGSSDTENSYDGLTSIPKKFCGFPKESAKKSPTPPFQRSLPAKKPLKLHRCRICSKTFACAGFLSKHFAHKHSSELKKVDNHKVCESVTMKIRQEKTDSSIVSPENKRASVECELCRMRFPDELLLKAHMPLHGEKGSCDFQCNICKKFFPCTLERHKYKENHYNSFCACHICGHKYVNQALLDYHLKTRHRNGGENSRQIKCERWTFVPIPRMQSCCYQVRKAFIVAHVA